MTSAFAYHAPKSRTELLDLLADYGETGKVLAGGTDLMADLRNGFARPAHLLNIKSVDTFDTMSWTDAGLVIRPGVTINDLLRDERARSTYPILMACGRYLASHQIRNRATVIGNVVNASPCADMSPALLCLGAHAVISSASGRREIPFTEFFTGVKRTVLQPDEILEEIIVPPDLGGARASYRKLKRIRGHDLGIVGVAAMSKDGALRLGISSCAPTPLLVAGLSTDDDAESIVAAAHEAISPITDVRCSREYRSHMVGVYVRRALQEVA